MTSDEKSTFTDPRDGKVYKTIKIGNQVWMAENLNYDAGSGSWCYDNGSSNCEKYGRLYDWKTAKKVTPKGWHLPSQSEFETLLNNLGGRASGAYNKIISGGSSGFNALFGGWRSFNGSFYNIGYVAYFWSSTEEEKDDMWYLYVNSTHKMASMNYNGTKSGGFYIRCIKDN